MFTITDKEKLRSEISKILIKWGMPTRQVAINEIISLLSHSLQGKIEKIKGMKFLEVAVNPERLLEKQRRNMLIEDIIKILSE